MDDQLERAVSSQLERDLAAANLLMQKHALAIGLSPQPYHVRDLIALADLIGRERRWRSSPGLGEGE